MKRTPLTLALVGLVSLGAGIAQAVTYSDVDNFSPDILFAPGSGGVDSYTSTFNILNAGYDPATEEILSATAAFRVYDDYDLFNGETVSVTLEGVLFGSSSSFNFGTITLNGSVLGTVLAELTDTGVISYTVTRSSGDFYLDSARLDAEAGPRAVPDGGLPLALLGVSIAGLSIFRRK